MKEELINDILFEIKNKFIKIIHDTKEIKIGNKNEKIISIREFTPVYTEKIDISELLEKKIIISKIIYHNVMIKISSINNSSITEPYNIVLHDIIVERDNNIKIKIDSFNIKNNKYYL